MGPAFRNSPPSTSAESDAERFVEQLDQMFIERLIEAGAFSYDDSDPNLELYEELDWVLRKIGFVEPGKRKAPKTRQTNR
jgi:hypothetical protein